MTTVAQNKVRIGDKVLAITYMERWENGVQKETDKYTTQGVIIKAVSKAYPFSLDTGEGILPIYTNVYDVDNPIGDWLDSGMIYERVVKVV